MEQENTYYQDTFYIRDRRIMLFTRPETIRPIYYARMNIPGVGYVVKSTKTENLRLASSTAEDMYDEYRWKTKNGI